MSALDHRRQVTMADLLDRIQALETQVRAIPSRSISAEPANLVLEVTQTGHGFVDGDTVRHNGTSWVYATAATAAADEKLGIVGLVESVNAFLVVLDGTLCLQGLDDWTIYYLAAGGGLTPTPPTLPTMRRAVVFHTTGGICQLIGPQVATSHNHRVADLRDVDTTTLADGNGLVWDATASKWKPGSSLPTDAGGTAAKNKILAGPTTGTDAAPSFRLMVAADLPSVAAKAVLANATNAAATPTAFAPTAADQILMATAAGLAWDQIQVASMKLAAGPRIIGRTGAGAGTAEEISVSARLALASSILDLATSGASAGSYGTATQVPSITVDSYGRVTAVSNTTISIPGTAVTSAVANANSAAVAGSLSSTLSVSGGGTGATTLTGYVKGSGTGAMTASTTIPWGDLNSVPSTFPPSAHTHDATDITSGTLPVARGGTGLSGSSFAVGDILYASLSVPATIGTLTAVATGKVLVSKGVATAPAWDTLTPAHLSTTAGFALWAKTTTGAGAMTEITALEGQVLALKASGAIGFTYSPQLGKNGVSAGSQTIYTSATKNSFWITSLAGLQFFESGDTTAAFEVQHDTSGITSLTMRRRTAANTFTHVVSINMADLATLTGSPGNQTIKLREIDVCSGGVTKKMMILASGPY